MNKKIGGLILVSLFLLLFVFMPIKTNLCIRDKNGNLVWKTDLGDANFFEITFRHSVNKGIVKERYSLVNQTEFYLDTAWFESYGAGMLDQVPPGVVITEDGGYLVLQFPKPEKTMRRVAYAAAGIANHILSIGNSEWELYKINPYKTSYISIENTSMFDQVFKTKR